MVAGTESERDDCKTKGVVREAEKGEGGETGTRGVGLSRQRSRTMLSFSRNQRRSAQKERDRDSLRIGRRMDTEEGKGQKGGEAEGALPPTNCRNFDYRRPYVPACS